jgi:hypothetical protein
MIIDNPHVMRDVIHKNAPAFTHPGAEEIYTARSADMDRYAQAYGLLAEKVWAEEYLGLPPVVEDAEFEWRENQKGVEAGQL